MYAEQLAQLAAQTARQASREVASATSRLAALEIENASPQQSFRDLIRASTAGPSSTMPMDLLRSIIDMKILTRTNTFDGSDESWRGWSFVFESMLSWTNLGDVLEVAVNEPDVHLNYEEKIPTMQLMMKALYHVLISMVKEKALTIMQSVPVNMGAWARRKLKLEYEAKSGGRFAATLMGN